MIIIFGGSEFFCRGEKLCSFAILGKKAVLEFENEKVILKKEADKTVLFYGKNKAGEIYTQKIEKKKFFILRDYSYITRILYKGFELKQVQKVREDGKKFICLLNSKGEYAGVISIKGINDYKIYIDDERYSEILCITVGWLIMNKEMVLKNDENIRLNTDFLKKCL